jgi:hypothetical protein
MGQNLGVTRQALTGSVRDGVEKTERLKPSNMSSGNWIDDLATRVLSLFHVAAQEPTADQKERLATPKGCLPKDL